MDIIREMFSYAFITRGIIVGLLVTLCCSLLGVNLVLKRYSMIGDGLSHVAFGAFAIAISLGFAPLQFSIPIVIVAAFFLLKMGENSKVKGDSAVALIASTSLAVGVMATSLNGGVNTDIYGYMFGSILAITKSDIYISLGIAIIVITSYLLFYHKIYSITFDEYFAKATGIKVNNYKMLISILTALTIVIGMRIMGTLLISSLIIFPALTSMRVCQTFKSVVITSSITASLCFILGVFLSFILNTPTGASIVLVNLFVFIIFTFVGRIYRLN